MYLYPDHLGRKCNEERNLIGFLSLQKTASDENGGGSPASTSKHTSLLPFFPFKQTIASRQH
jgi:hypothetical protein